MPAGKARLPNRFASICQVLCDTKQATDLSLLRPELQQEWHLQRNERFNKTELNPFSFAKAIWRCPHRQHEWEEHNINRACSNLGCQRCARNTTCAESKLPFMLQWDYRTNNAAGIYPENTSISSKVDLSKVPSKMGP